MTATYRLFYPRVPAVAEQAPGHGVFVGDGLGVCQVFAWDRRTGTTRQLTERARGTTLAAITPRGDAVWWFDDDLTGRGVWRISDFDGDHTRAALPGLPAHRNAGLVMTADGSAVVALAGGDGVEIRLRSATGDVRCLGHVDGYAHLVDVDPGGSWLALAGDPALPDAVTLRRVERDGPTTTAAGAPTTPATTPAGAPAAAPVSIPGAAGRRVWAQGFAPDAGAARLLLVLEVEAGYALATWTEDEQVVPVPGPAFDTEIAASWYPDGRAVLVRQDRHATSRLYRVDLPDGRRSRLDIPPGSVLDAAVWPDGDVAYIWTDDGVPPQLRSTGDLQLPTVLSAQAQPPPAYTRRELWVPGPGGDIHVLLAEPNGRSRPHPTVLLVHGGPSDHARRAYEPLVEVLVNTGCAVARVNYRGSSGYGPDWRNDHRAGVGATQVQDLAAVRDHLVAGGAAEAARVALWGHSWGGYLTLMALGLRPELWRVALAINPIADYGAAFELASPAVQAFDEVLFGGSPRQVPDAYRAASPTSYVDRITTPVFLGVATDDVRCPPEPVERFAGELARRKVAHRLVRMRAGHVDLDARNHLLLMQEALQFMAAHFEGAQVEGTTVALAMAKPAG